MTSTDPPAAADLVSSRGPANYVEDQVASAFFAARESAAYYRSLKSVDAKRAFHDQLSDSLTRLLTVAQGPGRQLIEDLLARAQLLDSVSAELPPRVTGHGAAGLSLLGVDVHVDAETLRTAYRSAARRHDPDRGGSNDEMAAINDAYEQLHAFTINRLASNEPADGLSFAPTRMTCADYCWSTQRLLFEVALDDWALEDALMALGSLTSGPLEQSAFGRTSHHRVGLIEPSVKLAERLTAAHRAADAERSLSVARWALGFVRDSGLNFGYFARAVEAGEAVVSGATKPRFIINHPRQLENAYRLGAVDGKRYETILARLQKRAADKEAAREEERRILASTGFVQSLPTDRLNPRSNQPADLVPQPGYFEVRLENLSSDQQAQYLQAFTDGDSIDLVQTYAWVRLSSLLRSAIYHTSAVDVCAIAAELRVLKSLQPKCALHADGAARIVDVLATLSPPDQTVYAAELQKLLEPKATRMSTSLGGIVMVAGGSPAEELGASFLASALAAAEDLGHHREAST